jgi:DNA-binding NarL/FixJ family response regulator
LRALAEGLTNAQIGARLSVSTGKGKAYTADIFRKLAVANPGLAIWQMPKRMPAHILA